MCSNYIDTSGDKLLTDKCSGIGYVDDTRHENNYAAATCKASGSNNLPLITYDGCFAWHNTSIITAPTSGSATSGAALGDPQPAAQSLPSRTASGPSLATFSAVTRGSALSSGSLPSDVQSFVSQAAQAMGISTATASTRIHYVRGSMGTAGLDMYAFVDDLGRPCFYVPTFGGACETISNTTPHGFEWLIGGSDVGSPSYLVALVGDDVRAVSLKIEGANIPVSVQDNGAFAQYRNTTANSAIVTVEYANGTQVSASLALK